MVRAAAAMAEDANSMSREAGLHIFASRSHLTIVQREAVAKRKCVNRSASHRAVSLLHEDRS